MSTWTLLITDDCQEDREVYRAYLSGDPDQSYQFIEAGSAEAGLALCQKQHCDAILLDFRLPDMTGLEFLDQLKQQSDQVPVIMLTGQGDERVAVQAMKRGAQDYLVKQNLEPDMLQVTVRNAIQQSHLQHQWGEQQCRRRLTAEVALRLHQSLELKQILQTAVTEVKQVLECDRVAIYRLNQRHSESEGRLLSTLTKQYEVGQGSADPVQQFLAFLTPPVNLNPNSAVAVPQVEQAIATHSIAVNRQEPYLLAPILIRPPSTRQTSQVWGLLVAQHATKRLWQADEIAFLQAFAAHLEIALYQSEQLTQAIEALEAKKQLNAIASQLVTTVSHEYRTPLAAILAAASTLKLHGNKLHELKQRQFLQIIEDKARQMAQMAQDLLVLETIEMGEASFTPAPFELLQFISDLVEEQRQNSGDCHKLTFKITGNTKGFWGDQQLLRLVLVNLLSNAIKYSTDGGNVDLHLIGNESHVLIEVKDHGIGIPVEDQPQLFQSFSRGSNVGTVPGTGLGLAIVKAGVELHGGKVSFRSQVGKGTQFSVCLPKRSPFQNLRR